MSDPINDNMIFVEVVRDNHEVDKMKEGGSILDYEIRENLLPNEVQLSNQSVHSITIWSDPLDDNTIFVNFMCDNHEVLVDEKSKRMDI